MGLSGSVTGLLSRKIPELAMLSFVSQKSVSLLAKLNQNDLKVIGDLMAEGRVTPVIDRHYSLSEVPEALRYLEEGHARGKVIIDFLSTDDTDVL